MKLEVLAGLLASDDHIRQMHEGDLINFLQLVVWEDTVHGEARKSSEQQLEGDTVFVQTGIDRL